MSLNVFYYLHVDNKFIKLLDLDEILCEISNVEVSSEKYMTPEGNSVSWVDMLAGILLDLPGHIKVKDLDFDEIIDAIYHHNSIYQIGNVNSYVQCFYYVHILKIRINAHYANLSMFDDESRKYYRSLYDEKEWFSKTQLLEYVKSIWKPSISEKSVKSIVNETYIRRKEKEGLIKERKSKDELMINRLTAEKGEVIEILEQFIDKYSYYLDKEVQDLYKDIWSVFHSY